MTALCLSVSASDCGCRLERTARLLRVSQTDADMHAHSRAFAIEVRTVDEPQAKFVFGGARGRERKRSAKVRHRSQFVRF